MTTSKLILLGTAGGPWPKKDRSAPANAVVVNDAIYVVDCGNGVARQMVRAGLDLSRLRSLFITHHHSDHNADYGTLMLLAWQSNLQQPVRVWGPPPLRRMTSLFQELHSYDIEIRQQDEGRAPLAPLVQPQELSEGGLVMRDENVTVTAALVPHPPVYPAFAYRFDCGDRSIVFSGDTAPSESLVELARGADVLVHEVIDLDAIAETVRETPTASSLRQHLERSHTPVQEVGRIATAAGVRTLVLNHFVPGRPARPDHVWFNAVKPHFAGDIIVGDDLMVL